MRVEPRCQWKQGVPAHASTAACLTTCARIRQETGTIGFQVLLLRHCFQGQQSLSPRQGSRKPNNGGLFAPDLLTGVAVAKAIWLSLPPFLSKPADSRF